MEPMDEFERSQRVVDSDLRREMMDDELRQMLMDHSPRLRISGPILLQHPASGTGWVVIDPRQEQVSLRGLPDV